MWPLVASGVALLLRSASAGPAEDPAPSSDDYPPFDYPPEVDCSYADQDEYVGKAAKYNGGDNDIARALVAECEYKEHKKYTEYEEDGDPATNYAERDCNDSAVIEDYSTCEYLDKKRYRKGKNLYMMCNEKMNWVDSEGETHEEYVHKKCPLTCAYWIKSKCHKKAVKYKIKFPYDDSCTENDKDIDYSQKDDDGEAKFKYLHSLGGCRYYDKSVCNCKLLDEKYYRKGDIGYSMCMYDIKGNKQFSDDWKAKDEYLVSYYCPKTCDYVASSKCKQMATKNYREENRDSLEAFDSKFTAGLVIFILLSALILGLYHFLGPVATGDSDWTLQFAELHEMQNHAELMGAGEHKSSH